MGGENPAGEISGDSQLHSAFNQLNVGPEWTLNNSENSVQNVTDFWKRNQDPLQSSAAKPKRFCHKQSQGKVKRMEPYPQDFLKAIEKLSFHSEDCRKLSCRCGELRLKSRKRFNYASSSIQHRPLIRDAKLKFHHSEKDTKQIIRAAKLKIFKNGKHQEPKTSTKATTFPQSSVRSPLTEGTGSETLFGATNNGSSLKSQDFASVIKGCKKTLPKSSESKCKYRFSGHRSVSGSKRARDHALESERSRNTYSDCGREMRCPESARLDETSVDELAGYFDDYVHIPKKMSSMAEMMYT